MSTKRIIIGVTAVALALGGIWAVNRSTAADTESATSEEPATTATAAAATATVQRGELSSDHEFDGRVGYGDTWSLQTKASGTVTAAHPVGTIVEFGDELIRVDDRPVFLLKGTMPMYRELAKVNTNDRDDSGKRKKLLSGDDVTQLQRFLVAQGFDVDGDLEVDGIFGSITEKAVKAWQEAAGLPVTGKVDSKQIVFSPQNVRIASDIRVGAAFDKIEVSGGTPSLTVVTGNRDRYALTVGTSVTVSAEGTEVTGTVTEQTSTDDDDGRTSWTTTIAVDGRLPVGATDATVTTSNVIVSDVLIVPVSALIALAEGGYAVEISNDDGTTSLVKVELGEVHEGRAQITSDGVDAGDKVVIAS